jgi:hypothetical protein
VRLISEICLNALTGRWIGDSITCYRDSGRGRKASQEEKTRSERYLNEIDPRRSFWGILRSKYHQIRCLSLLTGYFSLSRAAGFHTPLCRYLIQSVSRGQRHRA